MRTPLDDGSSATTKYRARRRRTPRNRWFFTGREFSCEKHYHLVHRDCLANQPVKLATYHRLTKDVSCAKDASGKMTFWEIAKVPPSFIRRENRASLGFGDVIDLAQSRRRHETLQMKSQAALEWLKRRPESLGPKLCHLSERHTGGLDELAAERRQMLEKESVELEQLLQSMPVGTQARSFLASVGEKTPFHCAGKTANSS